MENESFHDTLRNMVRQAVCKQELISAMKISMILFNYK